MSNHSPTPWNPDTDNTIAADAIDAGPRSATFSRLAYSDQLDIPDAPEDELTVAVGTDDGRWARRRVALALGGAASVIVASAAVAFTAISSWAIRANCQSGACMMRTVQKKSTKDGSEQYWR